jgi:DNA-binding IclR family transcriptional regulator
MENDGMARKVGRTSAHRKQLCQYSAMRKNSEESPIESVDRALRLVILLRERGPLSVTAAAEHLGVAPSTAHRLLSALSFRGFAVQDRNRPYRPGPQLAFGTPGPPSRTALTRLVRPALELLHQETDESTHLAVLSGPDIFFIDGVEGEQALRVGLRTGVRLPAYCTSVGRAMLAALPAGDVDQVYRSGLPPWRGSHITTMTGLRRQLTIARKQGYAVNQEESEQGVVAVGACLRDAEGRPVAGISVSIPSVRYSRSHLPRYAAALRAATAQAQGRLDNSVSDN